VGIAMDAIESDQLIEERIYKTRQGERSLLRWQELSLLKY
jgi:hypothetical protein